MKNYVLGYGSLIQANSRRKTVPMAERIVPVSVSGFARGWFARIGVVGVSASFLGCIPMSDTLVNGVLFEVSDSDLMELDKREIGYNRVLVNKSDISYYADFAISDENLVWIYVNEFENNAVSVEMYPTPELPIVQSYVDVCLDGCLEIESNFPLAKAADFARNFVWDTVGWNGNWVNDRIYPRRPWAECPRALEIDRLLSENLPDPDIFGQIIIE